MVYGVWANQLEFTDRFGISPTQLGLYFQILYLNQNVNLHIMSNDKWMHNTEKIQLGPITNTEPVIYPHNL